MELTHRDKDIIKSVIEGFTYHQKYKLYVELAKDLKEDDEFAKLLRKPQKPKPPLGTIITEGKELDSLKKRKK